MTLALYKTAAGFLIFLTTMLVVIYPIKSRAYPKHHAIFELIDALASGIFLGAALFHLLPNAIRSFATLFPLSHYPFAEMFCALGFMLLLFLERLSNYWSGAEKQASALAGIVVLILIVHAFIEGTVLGLNTKLETAAIIFLAILAHKSSESFALAVVLNRRRLSLKSIIIVIFIFSLMTPLGIALGESSGDLFHSTHSQLFAAGFNAFAAGTFLYMSTLHHINHHQRQHEGENLREFAALSAGLIVMGLLSLWV